MIFFTGLYPVEISKSTHRNHSDIQNTPPAKTGYNPIYTLEYTYPKNIVPTSTLRELKR